MSVEEFVNWAVSLGCPQDKIPKESTIKSVIQKKLVLQQLQQKINKKSFVEQVRMNILLSKINKTKGQVLSTTSKYLLPPEYQRFLKISKLNSQIEDISRSIKKAKLEGDDLFNHVKDQNIKKLELKKNLDDIKAQYYILKAQSMQLNKEVENETNLQSQIFRVTPVKLNSTNDNDSLTANALKSCLEELKNFYSEFDLHQSDENTLKSNKAILWEKLEVILKNIPNVKIWQHLITSLNSSIASLVQLSKVHSSGNSTETNRQNLEELLAKLYTIHIQRTIELCSTKNRAASIKTVYGEKFESFSDSIENKMQMIDNTLLEDDSQDDAIGEYIEKHLAKFYLQGKIQFTQKEVDSIKTELMKTQLQMNELQSLVQDVNNINQAVSEKAASTQLTVAQLYLIKDKLNYSKLSMTYAVQKKRNFNQQFNRTLMNHSIINRNSPFKGLKNNTVPSMEIVLPKYEQELEIFLKMDIRKFKQISWHLEFASAPSFLATNPQLKDVIKLNSTHLLTPNGFLEQIDSQIKWHRNILSCSPSLSIDYHKDDNLEENLKIKNLQNNEKIVELIDQIAKFNVNNRSQLKKAKWYFDFVLRNPLKKFIPQSRLFNGRNFQEFESDYMMYYRMIRK